MSTQVERQNIEWRRSKVIELNSQGYSQPETARILQVSLGTVNRDLSIIRQQARKNLQIHIEKTLPDEYNRCLTGLNQVLKTCWYIVNKPNITPDDKTRLQATTIISDSYKYIMDLVTNKPVITNAIERVIQLQNNLNIIDKCDKSLESLEASEEEVTTNCVF